MRTSQKLPRGSRDKTGRGCCQKAPAVLKWSAEWQFAFFILLSHMFDFLGIFWLRTFLDWCMYWWGALSCILVDYYFLMVCCLLHSNGSFTGALNGIEHIDDYKLLQWATVNKPNDELAMIPQNRCEKGNACARPFSVQRCACISCFLDHLFVKYQIFCS